MMLCIVLLRCCGLCVVVFELLVAVLACCSVLVCSVMLCYDVGVDVDVAVDIAVDVFVHG